MDNNKEKKEERTESIWFQVTPSVKKELDAAIDNDELKETIIKNFIKSETNWLVEEMKEIDDITIQYKAKLVQIKSNFKEAQSAYVEEIEKLIDISTPILNKLNNQFNVLNIKLHGTKEEAYNLNKELSNLPFANIERLFSVLDRYNNLSESDKQAFKLLLGDNNTLS